MAGASRGSGLSRLSASRPTDKCPWSEGWWRRKLERLSGAGRRNPAGTARPCPPREGRRDADLRPRRREALKRRRSLRSCGRRGSGSGSGSVFRAGSCRQHAAPSPQR